MIWKYGLSIIIVILFVAHLVGRAAGKQRRAYAAKSRRMARLDTPFILVYLQTDLEYQSQKT